jgi:hypothetical protein
MQRTMGTVWTTVKQELSFLDLVEAAQTGYPDCEAKWLMVPENGNG